MNLLGHPLSKVALDSQTLSEVLRQFLMWSVQKAGLDEDSKLFSYIKQLTHVNFFMLSARDKLDILALLCCEAISSVAITEVIDDAEERLVELRSEFNRKRDEAYGKRREMRRLAMEARLAAGLKEERPLLDALDAEENGDAMDDGAEVEAVVEAVGEPGNAKKKGGRPFTVRCHSFSFEMIFFFPLSSTHSYSTPPHMQIQPLPYADSTPSPTAGLCESKQPVARQQGRRGTQPS